MWIEKYLWDWQSFNFYSIWRKLRYRRKAKIAFLGNVEINVFIRLPCNSLEGMLWRDVAISITSKKFKLWTMEEQISGKLSSYCLDDLITGRKKQLSLNGWFETKSISIPGGKQVHDCHVIILKTAEDQAENLMGISFIEWSYGSQVSQEPFLAPAYHILTKFSVKGKGIPQNNGEGTCYQESLY